jgi:hypothetical protein
VSRTNVVDRYIRNSDTLRGEWDDDLSQQHTIIATVVDSVVVGPARPGYNRFDESRLTPLWRPRASSSATFASATGCRRRGLRMRGADEDPPLRGGEAAEPARHAHLAAGRESDARAGVLRTTQKTVLG